MADDGDAAEFVPRELHTMRQAATRVAYLATLWGLFTLTMAWFFRSLPGVALNALGSAAQVVLPMYLSAMLAAFVFLLVPGFRRDPGTKEPEQVAETRQIVGLFSGIFTSLLVVWVGWAVAGGIDPKIHIGGNAAVIVASPLLIALGILLTRVARGTLEQQRRDAASAAKHARARYDAVRKQTILRRRDKKPARWPPVVVVLGSALCLTLNVLILKFSGGDATTVSFGAVMVLFAFYVAVPRVTLYMWPDRSMIVISWIGIVTGTLVYVSLVAAEVAWALSSGLALVDTTALAIFALGGVGLIVAPWRTKQPLAILGLKSLRGSVEEFEKNAEQIERAIAPTEASLSPHPRSDQPMLITEHDARLLGPLQMRSRGEVELPVADDEAGIDSSGESKGDADPLLTERREPVTE